MYSTTTNTANPVPSAAPAKPKTYILNTSHRCDRCGCQAYFKVLLDSELPSSKLETDLPLYFCRHHFNKYELSLLPIVKNDIVDESDRLTYNKLMGTENN